MEVLATMHSTLSGPLPEVYSTPLVIVSAKLSWPLQVELISGSSLQ